MNLMEDNSPVKFSGSKKSRYRKHVLLVIISVVLFVMLALYVEAGITVGFEGWVYSEAVEHMSPVLTSIVKGITHIGDAAVVMSFGILLILIPKTRRTVALPVSLAVVLSALLNILLKDIFARERPDILRLINETSYSFPSGHAMINASLYTMLILMIFKFIQNKTHKTILSTLCILLIVLIGFSRIYLGVHYAGDIFGGWFIGFAVSILVYALWKRFIFKGSNDQADLPNPHVS